MFLNKLSQINQSCLEQIKIHPLKLFFLTILLIYGRTLSYDFVWDDYILYDDFIRKPLGSLLFSKLESIYSVHYYPVLLFSHKLDYLLSKIIFFDQKTTSHFIYAYIPHTSNLLIYFITSLFFYKCSQFFFKEKIICIFLTIIFIVHPVHVNSVAWISGRTDLLSTTFVLISLFFFLQLIFKQDRKFVYLSTFFYFLAVFSKIVAVNFLCVYVLIFFYFYQNGKCNLSTNIKLFFLLIIFIICIYFFAFLKFSLLGNDISSISILQILKTTKLVDVIKLISYYFEKGFFPLKHDIIYFNLDTYKISYIKIFIFFLFLYFSIKIFLKNKKNPAIFFISLFFLTLTTSYYSYFKSLDNTVFFSITTVAERYAFMPSIFAVLFTGSLLKVFNFKYVYPAKILIISIFFIMSFTRVSAYKNDLTFASYTPYERKTKLHFAYLHQVHLKDNKITEAEIAIREGMVKFPNYHKFYLLMSNIESKKNNTNQAEIFRTKARELSKDDPQFNFYAGKLFFNQHQYNISEEYLNNVLTLRSSKKIRNQTLIMLGRIKLIKGKLDLGIEYFKKSLQGNQKSAESYYYLGQAYLLKKNKEKSTEFYLKAIELDNKYLEIFKK